MRTILLCIGGLLIFSAFSTTSSFSIVDGSSRVIPAELFQYYLDLPMSTTCAPATDITLSGGPDSYEISWGEVEGGVNYLVGIQNPGSPRTDFIWSTTNSISFALDAIMEEVPVITVITICSGGGTSVGTNQAVSPLRYIDEFVLPSLSEFDGTIVGGLSSIDYADGTYYMICDDGREPIRFYTADLTFDENEFTDVTITSVTRMEDRGGIPLAAGTVDPEGLRVDPVTSEIVWTSEGNVNAGISPTLRTTFATGVFVREYKLSPKLAVDANTGPRSNGSLEGLSISHDEKGFWLVMELPLKQDGPAPTLEDTDSPVRLMYVDRAREISLQQYAYELEPVAQPPVAPTSFSVNGVVEILAIGPNEFYVLERSFSSGYANGGNTVKLFHVDASNATDVRGFDSLVGADYTPVTKTLVFDFEEIRDQLTDGVVDNIEGITFGPDLPNGNRSLVVVADDNFSAFQPQLNQFIVFEVNE
ncbi:MAG: esterase-like activity of phytase family protein [Bacteroidota bacterium]